METAPDVDEIFEFPRKRLLMRGQIRRVDSTGRHSGQHIRAQIRKRARQMPENADLVGGACAAAGQHESQVRTLVRNAYSLRWKDPWPHMIGTKPGLSANQIGSNAVYRVMSDLRNAFRALRATPIVTAVAILSLALGIGANTAIFSLINALILRSLPVK